MSAAVDLMPSRGYLNPTELARATGPRKIADRSYTESLEAGVTTASAIFGDDLVKTTLKHQKQNSAGVADFDGAYGTNSNNGARVRLGKTWMDSFEGSDAFTDDRNKRRAKSTPARARYAEAYHVILPSAEGDNRRRSVGAAGEETYRGEEETPRGEASPDGAVDGGAPPLSQRYYGAFGKTSEQLARGRHSVDNAGKNQGRRTPAAIAKRQQYIDAADRAEDEARRNEILKTLEDKRALDARMSGMALPEPKARGASRAIA